MKRLCDNLQGCQNEENSEVDLDDDGQVVLGEGVGQVGDQHQDGGRQEGGQQAAGQRSRQVERHLEARVTVLKTSVATQNHKPTCNTASQRKTPSTVYCSKSVGPWYSMDFGTRIMSVSLW